MLLLVFLYVTIASAEITFKYESASIRGPCITDCVETKYGTGKLECITKIDGTKTKCTKGNTPAWKYYTTQQRSNKKFCLSRCGKFDGATDDWCFVSNALEWDFCNSEKKIHMFEAAALTVSGIPCVTSCNTVRKIRNKKYEECTNYFNVVEECKSTPQLFVQSQNPRGVRCISFCMKRNGDTYNSCYDSQNNKIYCAPPARNYNQLTGFMKDHMNTILDSYHSLQSINLPRVSSSVTNMGYLEYERKISAQNVGLWGKSLNELGNPITEYLLLPGYLSNEPHVPVLVKAVVLNRAMYPRDPIPKHLIDNVNLMGMKKSKSKNDDEVGHLVAYQIGGPHALYNLVPQTHNLNHGWWKKEENLAAEVTKGGKVELFVAPLYLDLENIKRPDYISVVSKFYSPISIDKCYSSTRFCYSNDRQMENPMLMCKYEREDADSIYSLLGCGNSSVTG